MAGQQEEVLWSFVHSRNGVNYIHKGPKIYFGVILLFGEIGFFTTDALDWRRRRIYHFQKLLQLWPAVHLWYLGDRVHVPFHGNVSVVYRAISVIYRTVSNPRTPDIGEPNNASPLSPK